MANPQKENGYTPIANEILEQIYSHDFSGTQLKIILAVCRYTYGFSRKEFDLSLSFISNAINVSKRFTKIEMQKLIEANVISVVKESTCITSRVIALNKNYDGWGINVPQVNKCSPGEVKVNSTGEDIFPTPGEVNFPQDKQYIKQNIKQYKKSSPVQNLINYFCEKHKEKTSVSYLPNWGKDGKIIKDMLDGGYTPEYVEKAIDWYFKTDDDFIKVSGYTIGIFKASLPKYIQVANKYKDVQIS